MPAVANEYIGIEYAEQFINTIYVDNTKKTYRYALRRLQEFIGAEDGKPPYPVGLFTDELLRDFYRWLKKEKYKQSSITLYLASVQKFIIWLDANEYLQFQTGKALNKLKAEKGRQLPYQRLERDYRDALKIKTYYDTLPLPAGNSKKNQVKRIELLRDRAIVNTLYYTAGRVSEIISLTRENVLDGKQDKVAITGKGDKKRFLFFSKEARNAIQAYCRERQDNNPYLFISHRKPGSHMTRVSIWKVIQQATIALRIQSVSPHSFRHCRAQQLKDEGMDLDVLQAYLGHADISTTRKIYAPDTPPDKIQDQLDTYGL